MHPTLKTALALAGALLFVLTGRAAAPPTLLEGFAPHTDHYGDPLPDGAVVRVGSSRLRHPAMIPRFAFSRDGKRLASMGATVRVWDTADGRLLRELLANAFFPYALAFSPDGKSLVSAGEEAVVWDLATGKGQRLWKKTLYAPRPVKLAFSPDGKVLAVGCVLIKDGGYASEVHLLAFPSGRLLGKLETGGGDWYYAVAFSPDSKLLAVAVGGSFRVWDVQKRRVLPLAHKDVPGVLAFSPDSRRLALAPPTSTSSARGPVAIVDLRENKEVAKAGAGNANVRDLRFTPNGKTLMCAASPGRALALDPTGARQPRELLPKTSRGYYPVLSPDGKLAVFADDGALRVWDLDKRRERVAFDDHRADVAVSPGGWPGPLDVSLSPDGRRLATSSQRALRLWDARTGKPLKTVATGRFVPGLSWSPDGKALVAASEGNVGWWSSDSGALLRKTPLKFKEVQRVVLSTNSKLLCEVKGKAGIGHCWLNASTGEEEFRAMPTDGRVKAVSPDGKHYAVANTETVWLYAAGTERPLWKQPTLDSHTFMAFSGDGRVVVAANMAGVRAFETKTGRALGPAGRPRKSEKLAWTTAVCLAPDGRTAAVAIQQELLKKTQFQSLPGSQIVLYETSTGQVRRRLPVVDGLLRCAFTADGGKLLSGSNDQTALVWEVYAPRGRPLAAVTREQAKTLWEALGADAQTAFDAVCRLSRSPAAAVAVLKPRLRPAVAIDVAAVQRLLTALDADRFAEREAATAELAELGVEAEPLLRAALDKRPSAEQKRRIDRLLALVEGGGGPADWRRWRGLEALERAGTPEVVRLVRTLAGGAVAARLTKQARAALQRLRRLGLTGTE
jgi:WD40 repeat protein